LDGLAKIGRRNGVASVKTTNVFWDVVASYNEATWAWQIVLFLLCILLVAAALFHPNRRNQALLKGYLAFGFGWLAVAFFWMRDPSPVGRFFGGPLFAVIALLLVRDFWTRRIRFHWPGTQIGRIGMGIGLGLFLAYPLVSLLLGHAFPRMVTPIMPCPFALLGIVLLAGSLPEIDPKILALLLVWSAAGIPKVFGLFDVREDALLVLVGIGCAWAWLKSHRQLSRVVRS
jgi:hypothetical protein